MAKCSVCQHVNEEGSEYCEECGVKLVAQPGEAAPAPAAVTEPEPEVDPAPGRRPDADEVTEGNLRVLNVKDLELCDTRSSGVVHKTCPACGLSADTEALFCSQCGTRLEASGANQTSIRLKMVSGRNKDRVYQISRDEAFIGRLPENDIPLEADAYVSSRHTRIVREGENYFVEDLGSTNGTFLKVRKLTKLAPGDEIKIGQSIFKL
jgi:hypothetical protein